jgi:hypothetical protein
MASTSALPSLDTTEQATDRLSQKSQTYQRRSARLEKLPQTAKPEKVSKTYNNYLKAYHDLKCDLRTEIVSLQASDVDQRLPNALYWSKILKSSHQTVKKSVAHLPVFYSNASLDTQITTCKTLWTSYKQRYHALSTSTSHARDLYAYMQGHQTLKTNLKTLQESFRRHADPRGEAVAQIRKNNHELYQLAPSTLPQPSPSTQILAPSHFEQAKEYIDDPVRLRGLPKAAAGKTDVYLPPELPVVLKKCGAPHNAKRLEQMRQAKEICLKNGYTQLIIPEAEIYKDFIIETRLPILDHHSKVCIGFYLENCEKFEKTAEEFIGFLCQAELDDITGERQDSFAPLAEGPIPRYDNVSLFGEGKLGMIDLERFRPGHSPTSKYILDQCVNVIRFFPHHLDAILREAKKFDPNIERHRKTLEAERGKILSFFKKVYVDHHEHLQKHQIGLATPTEFKPFLPERKEELKLALARILSDPWYKKFLGDNPQQTIQRFNEQAASEILDEVSLFIRDLIVWNIQNQEKASAISSTSQLLTARTLLFSDPRNEWDYEDEGPLKRYYQLKKTIYSKIGMLPFKDTSDRNRCTQDLLENIFKELVGHEIVYYDPIFRDDSYNYYQCIFC